MVADSGRAPAGDLCPVALLCLVVAFKTNLLAPKPREDKVRVGSDHGSWVERFAGVGSTVSPRTGSEGCSRYQLGTLPGGPVPADPTVLRLGARKWLSPHGLL